MSAVGKHVVVVVVVSMNIKDSYIVKLTQKDTLSLLLAFAAVN